MNSLSEWVIKIHAYESAQFVSMTQPFICQQFLQLKVELFNVSINAKKVVIIFVGAVHLEYFSKDDLTDLIPSSFGMLMHNDFTASETRYVSRSVGKRVFSKTAHRISLKLLMKLGCFKSNDCWSRIFGENSHFVDNAQKYPKTFWFK